MSQPTVSLTLCVNLVLAMVTRGKEASQLAVDSSHLKTFNFLELETMAYEVEIGTTPVPELSLGREEEPDEMTVLSKHGQRYSCRLPSLVIEEKKTMEEEALAFEKLPNISSLLLPLSERECLVKTVGWWTYEYCHGRFVRQFHMEAGRIVGKTTYLGFYEKETEWDQQFIDRVKGILDAVKNNIGTAVAQAYHTVYYVNGTECDVTQKPRTAQVEIHCTLEGVDKLVEVKEESTCNYTLSVQSPMVCSHPLLSPKDTSLTTHTLTCSPLLSQMDYEDYLLKQELIRQQKEKLKDLEAAETISDEKDEDMDEKSSDAELEGEFLSSSELQLLRRLVMKSISQLADIASGSLYDSGYKEGDGEGDLDIDVQVEFGEEEEADNVEESNGGRSSPVSANSETEDLSSPQEKVSDKVKRMANDAKGSDRESNALETFLANLAETAEYIESLDDPPSQQPADNSYVVPSDITGTFQTGEDTEMTGEKGERDFDDNLSVRGPEKGKQFFLHQRNDPTLAQMPSSSSDAAVRGELRDSEVKAENGVSFGKNEQQESVEPQLVREIERHVETSLEKELDDNVDIKVKIIALSDDQQRGLEDPQDADNESDSDRLSETMARAVSRLLDKILNEEDESVSEERQKQLNLQDSYDKVWSSRQKEKAHNIAR